MSNEATSASEQPQAPVTPSEQPVTPIPAESPGKDPTGLSIEEMVAELPSEVVDAIGTGIDPVEALAQHGAKAGQIEPSTEAQEPSPTPENHAAEPEPEATYPPSEQPGENPPEPEALEPTAAPPGAKRGARIRLDHLKEDDKALVFAANKAVTAGEFSSFQDAYAAQIADSTPAVPTVESAEPLETPPEPQAPPEPVIPDTVAELDAQIAENEAAQKRRFNCNLIAGMPLQRLGKMSDTEQLRHRKQKYLTPNTTLPGMNCRLPIQF